MSVYGKNTNTKTYEYLNIENLFSTETTKPHTNGKIDIKTLFSNVEINEEEEFDPYVLIESEKRKKEKLKESYLTVRKSCMDTVTRASKNGVSDVMFQIPHYIPECINYNMNDCITEVINHLRSVHLSCCKIYDDKIFISWKDLESKLQKINQA